MYTFEDVKTKLIDHLMSVNLSDISMDELLLYVKSITETNTLYKPDFTDSIVGLISKSPCYGFGSDSKKEVE